MNKISPNPNPNLSENRANKADGLIKGNSRAGTESRLRETGDTVALSSQAIDIGALEARISQLPDIDAARVVDLHNRIVTGEYSVDSESVADKLLNLERIIER